MILMTSTSLEALRTELGLKQGQLAKAAGVTQSTISLLENSEQAPTLRTARKIWEAINRLRAEKGLSRLGFEEIDWNW